MVQCFFKTEKQVLFLTSKKKEYIWIKRLEARREPAATFQTGFVFPAFDIYRPATVREREEAQVWLRLDPPKFRHVGALLALFVKQTGTATSYFYTGFLRTKDPNQRGDSCSTVLIIRRSLDQALRATGIWQHRSEWMLQATAHVHARSRARIADLDAYVYIAGMTWVESSFKYRIYENNCFEKTNYVQIIWKKWQYTYVLHMQHKIDEFGCE
jgi:hypothetical protein